jgi:hypothetical protein
MQRDKSKQRDNTNRSQKSGDNPAAAPPTNGDQQPPAYDPFLVTIVAAWNKRVQSIFDTGRALIKAKKKLPPEEFKEMIEDDRFPFDHKRTGERVIKVAKNRVLATHVSQLPPSWGTLYELTKLPPEELTRMLENGEITPDTERKDVEELFDKLRQESINLANALNMLIRLREEGLTAKILAMYLMKLEEGIEPDEGKDPGRPDLPHISELSSWITKLNEACEQVQAEEEKSDKEMDDDGTEDGDDDENDDDEEPDDADPQREGRRRPPGSEQHQTA